MPDRSRSPSSSDVRSTSASAGVPSEVGDPEDELAALFTWIPPSLEDGRPYTSTETQIISPSISFFDKHIDQSRILKHVVRSPTIRRAFCTVVDDALTFFKANNIDFPPVNTEHSLFETASRRKMAEVYLDSTGLDAEDVQSHYAKTVGRNCIPAASGLFLKSHFPDWFRLISLRATGEVPPTHVKGTSIEDLQVRLDLDFLSPSVTSSSLAMERLRRAIEGTETETVLKSVDSRFQHLLTLKVLPPFLESDALLGDMEGLYKQDIFSWEICHTSGFPSLTRTALPRSVDHVWEPVLGPSTPPNPIEDSKSSKKHVSAEKTSQSGTSFTDSVTPSLPKRQNIGARQARTKLLSNFMQRAWAEAVDKDTTFILFRSGCFERVAMRERNTQTLHLSELYDIREEGEIPYSKMHVGLFLATINDASGRAKTLESFESQKSRSSKTHAKLTSGSSSKKQADPPVAVIRRLQNTASGEPPRSTRLREEKLRVLDDIGRRNLLLIILCFGNFNSPAPVSVFRTGRAQGDYDGPDPAPLPTRSRKYSVTEYISISLGASIGKGATGIAHSGRMTVILSDGSSKEHVVVVKLAFNDMQRARLRHEYRVYERLVGANVMNILRVWGLFENDSEYLSVLVLEPGGESLRRLKSQRKMLDPRDCVSFYKILANINAAGVTHGDLRPENLLVDERGRPTIIDFDLAAMTGDNTPAPSEIGHLKTMFEVYYKEKNG